MKKSWTLITLVAALAASAASATDVTPAGTEIKNVADIYYTPEPTPTDPNPTETHVPSNPVVTTVLPVPSFGITPNDNNSAGPKDTPHYDQPGQNAAVKPCQKDVSFLYVLSNTGNMNSESYVLTNTPPTGAVKAPENVRFALDANNNGTLDASELAAATPTLTITGVNQGESRKFFQIYDIPCTADIKPDDKFGADPTGTRNDNTSGTGPNGQPYPGVPNVSKDADNTNVSTIGTVADRPKIGPSKDPLGAEDATTTPQYNSPEGIAIVPNNNDQQIANLTETQTTITFTNTVKNTGERPDVYNISQNNTLPTGSKVEFFKPDGTVLPDTNNDGKPDVGSLKPGETADILVKITLPAGLKPTDVADETAVTVIATSSNTGTLSDPTKDIIKVNIAAKPSVSFGDPTATPGGDPTPVGTPPTGTPGNPSSPVQIPDSCTAPILTFLPMEVANTGNIDDLYNVTGTAPIYTINAATGQLDTTPVNVPVVYYKDVNGNGVYDAATDTALVDTNNDGKADTGTLKPGEEMKLIAVVNVPCAAGKQTVTLNQVAESPKTGVKVPDTNDTISIGTNGKVPTIVKTADKATAKPGDTITYNIIGKNLSNGNVNGVKVCDTVQKYTDFAGADYASTVTSTVKPVILLQVDDGVWSTSINPSLIKNGTATALGSKLCVGVDTNNDGTIDAKDTMKPGESITMNFKLKIQ